MKGPLQSWVRRQCEWGPRSLAPTSFPRFQSRAALKGSGVRGWAGLSEGKATAPEGPSGQAAQQTAVGSVRAGSRIPSGRDSAEFLTLELSCTLLPLTAMPASSPFGNMAYSATSHLQFSSVLVPELHSAAQALLRPFCLPVISPICASGPVLVWADYLALSSSGLIILTLFRAWPC